MSACWVVRETELYYGHTVDFFFLKNYTLERKWKQNVRMLLLYGTYCDVLKFCKPSLGWLLQTGKFPGG